MSKDILNEKIEETVKRIHLLVTDLCSRNCPNCCNKCYSLNDIPVVTDEELSKAEWLFLTGGEPFEFCNVGALAKHYKTHYPNIKNIIVYGNMREFFQYLSKGSLDYIDGVSLSIKSLKDLSVWNYNVSLILDNDRFKKLVNNRVYNFVNLQDANVRINVKEKFPVISRDWVDYKDWKPNPDSIFRKAF